MSDRSSATIIPFPTRAATAEEATKRLRTALAALDAAVRHQRAAVADWQSAIGDLRSTMSTLGTSLHHYHAPIGALGANVETLADTARRLQAAADPRPPSEPA